MYYTVTKFTEKNVISIHLILPDFWLSECSTDLSLSFLLPSLASEHYFLSYDQVCVSSTVKPFSVHTAEILPLAWVPAESSSPCIMHITFTLDLTVSSVVIFCLYLSFKCRLRPEILFKVLLVEPIPYNFASVSGLLNILMTLN